MEALNEDRQSQLEEAEKERQKVQSKLKATKLEEDSEERLNQADIQRDVSQHKESEETESRKSAKDQQSDGRGSKRSLEEEEDKEERIPSSTSRLEEPNAKSKPHPQISSTITPSLGSFSSKVSTRVFKE